MTTMKKHLPDDLIQKILDTLGPTTSRYFVLAYLFRDRADTTNLVIPLTGTTATPGGIPTFYVHVVRRMAMGAGGPLSPGLYLTTERLLPQVGRSWTSSVPLEDRMIGDVPEYKLLLFKIMLTYTIDLAAFLECNTIGADVVEEIHARVFRGDHYSHAVVMRRTRPIQIIRYPSFREFVAVHMRRYQVSVASILFLKTLQGLGLRKKTLAQREAQILHQRRVRKTT